MGWLLYGAIFFNYPDWDIGICFAMAIPTYLTAEWVWKSIFDWKSDNWLKFIGVPLLTWFCVDGSYWLYWSFVNPSVMIREGQWPMSLCLYLLAGFVWSNSESVHQLFRDKMRQVVAKMRG